MAKYSAGGFVCLPGGYGTFEEMMEMITWNQVGRLVMVLNSTYPRHIWRLTTSWRLLCPNPDIVGRRNRGRIYPAPKSISSDHP
jgi:hypothetical protein